MCGSSPVAMIATPEPSPARPAAASRLSAAALLLLLAFIAVGAALDPRASMATGELLARGRHKGTVLFGATGHHAAAGATAAANGHSVVGYQQASKAETKDSGHGSRIATTGLKMTGHDKAAGANMMMHGKPVAGTMVAKHGRA